MYPNQVYSWDFIWTYILQCSTSRSWLFQPEILSQKEALGILSNESFFYEFDSCVSISKHHEKQNFKDSMILSVCKTELSTILGFGFRKTHCLLQLIRSLTPNQFDKDSINPYLEADNFQSRIVKKYLHQNSVRYLIGMEFTWFPDGSLLVTTFSRPSAPASRNGLSNGTFDKTQCVDVRHCESRLFSPVDTEFLLNASKQIDNLINPNYSADNVTSNGNGSLFDPIDTNIKLTGFSNGFIVPIHNTSFEQKDSKVGFICDNIFNNTNNSYMEHGFQTYSDRTDNLNGSETDCSNIFAKTEVINTFSTFELDLPFVSNSSIRKKHLLSLKVLIEKSPSQTGVRLQAKSVKMLSVSGSNSFYLEEEEDCSDILYAGLREASNSTEDNCSLALKFENVHKPSFMHGCNAITGYPKFDFTNANTISTEETEVDFYSTFDLNSIVRPTNSKFSDSSSKPNSLGWKCEQCGKIIQGKRSNLNRHVEYVHNKKYSYKCQEKNCFSKFQSLGNLNRHILAVHKEKKFNCIHCTRKFKSDRLMRKHIDIAPIFQKGRFRCTDCGGCYSRKMVLQRHLKMSHG